MRRGNFITALSICLLGMGQLHAQLFYNNGSQVTITPGGILYVEGAAENANGQLSNAGQTTIIGYFKNGSTATGGDTTSYYNVFGDWENNSTFIANHDNVVLKGNAQNITGTAVTTFYNLNLQTSGAVKTQTIDANVAGVLSLNDCELATGDYNMDVVNVDTAAITRNSGFVSSTGPGRLFRSTNTTNTYNFPTGYNNSGLVIVRPVEFSPSVTDSQAFSVRFAYNDPTLDGFNTSTKAGNVDSVNQLFYHLLKQYNSGASAALSIYYDPANDGSNWNSIGRWQTIPEWQNLDSANDIAPVAAAAPYYRMTKIDWTDNGREPHALIKGEEINVQFAFPNVFAPNSVDPTNNNNTFHIINEGDLVTVQELRVFDRWGELVYEGSRDGDTRVTPSSGSAATYCWDGKYKGKLQPMGNYTYVASVKILDSGKIKTVSGDLSLLW